MLKSETWQPVPGMEHALVYPIVNTSTFYVSNAFIIQTPNLIMLIDPGDLTGQIETIRHAIDGLPVAAPRPVIVFLTHCHVDHCFELLANPAAVASKTRVFVALQENGFKAISLKDRELTGAGRYRKRIPDPNLDLCLLSAEDRRFNVSKHLELLDGLELDMVARAVPIPGGNTLSAQDISCGGARIRAHYTPGHSPDSTTFHLGHVLFVGDAIFAADHFISGLPGWSRDGALASAQALLWLIGNGKISVVAPGHGEVMTAEKATARLTKMIAQLSGLKMQKELDLPAILAASEHAIDVSRETRDIMAVMADSLGRVVHYLNVLQESREADKCAAVLNMNRLDNIFAAFNEMAGEMQSGKLLEMGLVVRFTLLFIKMRAMLRAEGLESIVGHTLLTRLERMLDDFSEDSGGRCVKQNVEVFQVGAFLHELVDSLKKDAHADAGIFDAVEDDHAFVLSLIKRIAFRPIYRSVALSISGLADLWISADRGRLAEIVEMILECLLEAGNTSITFSAAQDEHTIMIALDGESIPACLLADGYQKRALARRLNWIGGRFWLENRPEASRLVVRVPSAAPKCEG